jgi:hypothetical protein
MADKTCILILNTPYSGGSVVAGILNNLGVPVGEDPSRGIIDYHAWQLNTMLCGQVENPKISYSAPRNSQGSIKYYLTEKKETMWGACDVRFCMTAPDYMDAAEAVGVELLVIIPVRTPHHSVLNMLKAEKDLRMERAADLFGRYSTARSMNTERFLLLNKDNKEKVLYVSFEQMIENPKEVVDSIVSFLKLEPSQEQKDAATASVKKS